MIEPVWDLRVFGPIIENIKIENLKWLGLSVIAFVLVVAGAVAQAQQPKKVPRIGLLYSVAGFL